MRIKRHDVSVQVFTISTTADSEGNAVPTLVALHNISADFQSVGSKSILEQYGVDGMETRKAFCDLETDLPLNAVALVKGHYWQVVNVQPWYDHAEAILTEYRR